MLAQAEGAQRRREGRPRRRLPFAPSALPSSNAPPLASHPLVIPFPSPHTQQQTETAYIPGGQTVDRYLWTVQWLIANGWYVLIDSHPMSQELASHDAKEFVANWRWLWAKVACLPNFEADMKGRLFVDVLNEPDSQGQGWQPKDGKAGERCWPPPRASAGVSSFSFRAAGQRPRAAGARTPPPTIQQHPTTQTHTLSHAHIRQNTHAI